MKPKEKDKSIYVHQSSKIDFDLNVTLKFALTPNQQKFVDLIEDKKTKIVICRGPAGSGKSYYAIYAALKALKEKRIGEIYYIRQPVESSSFSIGWLKGGSEDKLKPFLQPMMDKIVELVPPQQIKLLDKEERFKGLTIGHLRGLSINASYVISDEVQNFLRQDFLLAMTRIGLFSKLIMTGDTRQSDLPNSRQGDFERVYNLFDNEESKQNGIFTFSFGKEDIVRAPFIGFVLDKFEILGK